MNELEAQHEMNAEAKGLPDVSDPHTFFHVSFDFEDVDPNANTSDLRDLLMEKFGQEVLEGRMTNVVVRLDHARMIYGPEDQRRAFAEGRVVYLGGILVDREDHPTYETELDGPQDEG